MSSLGESSPLRVDLNSPFDCLFERRLAIQLATSFNRTNVVRNSNAFDQSALVTGEQLVHAIADHLVSGGAVGHHSPKNRNRHRPEV